MKCRYIDLFKDFPSGGNNQDSRKHFGTENGLFFVNKKQADWKHDFIIAPWNFLDVVSSFHGRPYFTAALWTGHTATTVSLTIVPNISSKWHAKWMRWRC